MKTWINFTRWIKFRAPGGAFEFFTYAELLYWFMSVIVVNPFRWKWAAFVLFGVGAALPRAIVEEEDRLRGRANGGKMNGSVHGSVDEKY